MKTSANPEILAKFAGLCVGVLFGVFLAPLLFRSMDPVAVTGASILGGILGFVGVSLVLMVRAYRRDLQLQHAVEAVRTEAGLPGSIAIKINRGRAILTGTARTLDERSQAELAIATLPGVKGVLNRIELRTAA